MFRARFPTGGTVWIQSSSLAPYHSTRGSDGYGACRRLCLMVDPVLTILTDSSMHELLPVDSGSRAAPSFAKRIALSGDRLADRRRPSFPDRRDCERRGRIARADRDRGARRGRGDCVCRCVHGLTGTRVNRHASGRGRVAADADLLGSAAGAARPCIRMRARARSVPTRACASGVYMTRGPTRVGRPVVVGRIRRAGLPR